VSDLSDEDALILLDTDELPAQVKNALLEKLLNTSGGLEQLARHFDKLSPEFKVKVINEIVNQVNGDRSKLTSLNLPSDVLDRVEQELNKLAAPPETSADNPAIV
jgi:tRNA A37 threonylcarbamoyladenosine dehydratase